MVWDFILGALVILAVGDIVGFLMWYACSWPRSQVLGSALFRGRTDGNRIALTFDDGPLAPYTGQILDILQSRNIPAAFFLCGKDAERQPDIVRRIHSEGHTIGNHTWSHPYLYFMSRARIAEEIDRTQDAVRRAAGCTPELFRPPYGGRWFGLYPVLKERGMRLVQWSVSGNDWELGAEAVVAAVRANLRPGALILLHDGRQKAGGYLHRLLRKNAHATNCDSQDLVSHQPDDASETIKALPAIIDAAEAMGYEFVPVEELFPTTAGASKSALSK